MALPTVWNRVYRTLAAVRTGIYLIIAVGCFAALGTVVLQRPTSEPDEMARAYSPEALRWLDRLGLTDIFHTWWFLLLLMLFCVCLLLVTLERWPNTWKLYARPQRFVPPAQRPAVSPSVKIAFVSEAAALEAAERVMRHAGYTPQRIDIDGRMGVFAERQRLALFAVYFIHLSLITMFAGYIMDGLVGYRGMVMVPEGESRGEIALRDNRGNEAPKPLPFTIRCDGAGEETYADGSPKRWWSKLVLLEGGREVAAKMIVVNDPLLYHGIRIYQASMGQSGTPRSVNIVARPASGGEKITLQLALHGTAALPDGETVSLLRWVPDYYIQDQEVYNKSNFADNPAVQLGLTNTKGETKKMWILLSKMNSTRGQNAPWEFAVKDFDLLPFTGLEVSYQPGQFGVWLGVVLLAIGLVLAFYMQHSRVWAAVEEDGRTLWLGGAVSKHRERFQDKFAGMARAIEREADAKK